MKTIKLIDLDDILEINQAICDEEQQKSFCMDRGKVESALSTTFYPGDYPFHYGGIPRVAGALCFFLIKAQAFMDGNKRTGILAATLFLDLNDYELHYPLHIQGGITAFTNIVENVTVSYANKDSLLDWFEVHCDEKRMMVMNDADESEGYRIGF